MKKPKFPFLFDKLGVSYTISAVIMTVTAISLTLVAASYAYQILEQQRGATEFDVAMESILAFNDALENIAWKPQASRSSRFTIEYGQLDLVPDRSLIVNVTGGPDSSYSLSREFSTGYISYSTKTKYVRFEEGYQSYFLGSKSTITSGAGSYGRASITQKLGEVCITLSYGVRAMKTSTFNVTQGNEMVSVNSVDIWIIRISIPDSLRGTNIGDFDLKARCVNSTTIPECGLGGYDLEGDKQCNISVQLEEDTSLLPAIQLDAEKVVFNFVVATVQVTV